MNGISAKSITLFVFLIWLSFYILYWYRMGIMIVMDIGYDEWGLRQKVSYIILFIQPLIFILFLFKTKIGWFAVEIFFFIIISWKINALYEFNMRKETVEEMNKYTSFHQNYSVIPYVIKIALSIFLIVMLNLKNMIEWFNISQNFKKLTLYVGILLGLLTIILKYFVI
ncbi:MAG: hypothetical protein H7Y00_16890 [Fimbriimonadaceae bacterium]|nr:hypothetical protein [Chitinophagales bacterium]